MREKVRDRGRLEHITEFRDSHSDVNWRQIERMRHVLVHGYYSIDPESLWDTIEVDIPELKPWIVRYLSE